MSKGSDSGLLELLKGKGNGANSLAALAAKAPTHDPAEADPAVADNKLNEVLSRIVQLTGTEVRRGETPQAGVQPAAPRPSVAAGGPASRSGCSHPVPVHRACRIYYGRDLQRQWGRGAGRLVAGNED